MVHVAIFTNDTVRSRNYRCLTGNVLNGYIGDAKVGKQQFL